MSPEAATLYAALITLAGTIAAVFIQQWPGRRPPRLDPEPTRSDSPPIRTRLERVLADRTLRCGCVKHPPLADFQHSGNDCLYGGLYVDLAHAVASTAGLSLEFIAVDWADLPSSFTDLELDLVLSVFETKARLLYGDFVSAFHKIGVGGVSAVDSDKVQSVTDLGNADVRIVVARGEAGWEYAVQELRVPKHRLIVVENASLPELMDYVVTGRVDVAICDDWSCHEGVARNPGLKHIFVNDPLYLCKNAIMVPKGDPEFAAWVDEVFSEARLRPDLVAEEVRILAATNGLIRRFR